ncbi:MAG: hypothetical protein ACIARQ_15420 [Phycisphaerales bacterium JB061]
MVRVLKDSYCSPDDLTRARSISWLRERTTPAAFQVLYRAKNDPTEIVRAEAMLGLSEIAPEYRLDAFQMRNIEPTERAELIRRAADEGQIDEVSLRSIAADSSASGIERAQALQELSRLNAEVTKEAWVPLLGVDDDRTRLIAALAVVTTEPESRSVALAQDHAISLLRQGVVDASGGKISTVIDTLQAARRAPTEPLADWASALMNACKQLDTPEQHLVWREAMRTLLAVDPNKAGLQLQWNRAWSQAKSSPGDATTLAFWAFEAACAREGHGIQTPAWLVQSIRGTSTGDGDLLSLIADCLEDLSMGQALGAEQLVAIIEAGGVRVRAHSFAMLTSLPSEARAPALVSLLTNANENKLDAWLVRSAADELAQIDLAAAASLLASACESESEDLAIAFVLAGVWSETAAQSQRLHLMRSLVEAEQLVEGPRSEHRADLADEMAQIAAEDSGFALPIRAEAAWLAMVLRDQTSEAMAHLPRRQNSLPSDLSPEGEHADSPLQWAQMQYP